MTRPGGPWAESIEYRRVADLYDTYVTATFDIPFFLNETRQVAGGTVLELMSGTGRVSVPLIEAGVRLTCVDISPELLGCLRDKLQARGLQATVLAMDVRELSLPQQYDLIILPFHSFSELVLEADQRAALARIREHLSPTGRFICTLQNPAVKLKTIDGQLRLWGKFALSDPPGTLLLWGMQQLGPDRRIVEGLQMYEEYDGNGLLRSKRLMELRYCLHSRDEFAHLAGTMGFRVERLYGDYEYGELHEMTSPFTVWVLAADG
jgi:SAM-dependent methyltransferase